MRTSILLLLSAAFVVPLPLVAQDVPPSGPAEIVWYRPPESPLPAGVEYRSFESASMNVEVGYLLYQPPGEPDGRLPVFYWLPGSEGHSSDLPLVEAFAAAVAEGSMDPSALVVAAGIPATGYLDDPDTGIMGASVVMRELLPHIEGSLPIGGEQGARAIGGVGVGGGAALGLALQNPDAFGAVVSLGGAFTSASEIQRAYGVSASVAADADPFALSIEVAPRLRSIDTFLRVGSDDPWVAANRRFAAHLGHQNLTVDYVEMPRVGGSLDQYIQAVGPELLRFLSRSID